MNTGIAVIIADTAILHAASHRISSGIGFSLRLMSIEASARSRTSKRTRRPSTTTGGVTNRPLGAGHSPGIAVRPVVQPPSPARPPASTAISSASAPRRNSVSKSSLRARLASAW